MPLSNKTILDSHCFVHELKTEMHDDLEYVKSLEKEIDKLESEKADFSNIYDLLLEECVSKDVTCSYLHSLSDLNANTELQCLYLHKVKECECLALKLSKQTESVNKEVHNNLLKSFSKLEKHSISLELALQQFTQQNLPQIRKQAVRNTNVIAPGPSRNCPKHVSHQSPREKVGSNDMVHNYYLEKAKKSAQLQKDKDEWKPSMIDPARLPNTANGCKPKPRNWQASMSSRVSNKDVHLGEHRKQKPFLKFNDLQCPTCKKCLYSANHDECVLEYLSRLNPRSSAQNKDAKSHKTTKRYIPVEKSSASKKPERQIPTGHTFLNKNTTTVPEKTMNPRSCLRWKPTGRIFSNVRLRWIPTGKLLNSCTGKVDSEPAHGSIVDIPHIHACKQTLGLSAGTSFNGQKQQRIDLNADALYNEKQENLRVWLLKLLISKKPVPEWPRLVLHQMTSDHNRSELGIQDHSNEPSSSKLVPKVVPLAVKTATSRQELELLFHHHIAPPHKRGKVYNWETSKYGKIWYDEDVHDLRSVETEFPAIVFDDAFTLKVTPSYEPTVSPLNDNKIDFRISFDEFDDEDYTVIYDENSFSYKIIYVNDLKTDSENDNDKVNMPSFPSPEPTVSYSNDLDFFKDFENEFPAIVYNDGLTSKSDFLTEPTISPQRIDEFNLKDETSLSECDEEEQNVLYFNNLFPFNVIYPDDSKSGEDNDDDKINIQHSLGDLSIEPLPNEIKINA
ncbi:hypothetical protein Tco_0059817 [Tanacetum coccineum]